jgi:hypothetical protein
MTNDMITEIIMLTSKDVQQVARLHIHGIGTGFISSLGLSFVTALLTQIKLALSTMEVRMGLMQKSLAQTDWQARRTK